VNSISKIIKYVCKRCIGSLVFSYIHAHTFFAKSQKYGVKKICSWKLFDILSRLLLRSKKNHVHHFATNARVIGKLMHLIIYIENTSVSLCVKITMSWLFHIVNLVFYGVWNVAIFENLVMYILYLVMYIRYLVMYIRNLVMYIQYLVMYIP
jgi:hypothetical protein